MALAHVRRGSGPPLVLIHGIGSQWQMWQPVLDRVSREREVVAVDLPGFGDSAELPGAADDRGARRRGRGVPRRDRAGRRARRRQLARRRRRARDGARGRRRARPACSPPPASATSARAPTRAALLHRLAPRRAAPRPHAELVAGGPVAAHARLRPPRRAAVARSPPTRPRARCATSPARPASRPRSRRSRTTASAARTPELPGHRRLGREGPAADLLAPERPRAPAAARRAPRDAAPAAATSRPGTTRSRSRGCCWRRSAS